MQSAEPIRLSLELERESQPIRGRVVDEDGDVHSFGSWLELISVLDAAAERAGGSDDAGRPGTGGSGDGRVRTGRSAPGPAKRRFEIEG